jgi:sugar/nucleoside kinase (ribokinase family)
MPDLDKAAIPPCGVFAGVAAVDIIYGVERVPNENSKIMADRRLLVAGGPAANAAITFGFLNGQARLISAVGTHALASIIHSDLALGNVELVDLAPPGFAPIISSILITKNSGQRTVISSTGPRLQLASDSRSLDAANFLLVDGHYLSIAIELARMAHERDIPVILDGGSWKPGLDQLLPLVDVAICSDDFHPPDAISDDDVVRFLNQAGVRHIAITHGEHPVRYFSAGGSNGRIPVPQITAVDTLGAGDIFHGAFCYSWSGSGDFAGSLEFAVKVASESCRYFGPREWMRHFSETLEPDSR